MSHKKRIASDRFLISLLLLFVCFFPVFAQSSQLHGTVVDANGIPVPGVTVVLKGAQAWTTTDVSGVFHLTVPDRGNGTLEFQCVGFDTKEVKLDGTTEYSVRLDETISELDEVVVVGYGEQKKANLTGAVSSMRVSEVTNIPVSNTASLLQGRMSGVTVSNFSGQPGKDGDLQIRIRGIGTFNNADPLILIDGVEGSLGSVSAEDIESISVLKDAAAAAIYGVRASNGVVLVTTKRGEGEKTLAYSGSVGVQQATILPTFVDSWQWATLFNEENAILGDESRNYTEAMIQKMKDGSDPDHFANTNWMKELFRTAPMHRHYLSMNGGNKDSHYLASLGYLNQEGIMLGTGTSRANFRLNADTRFLDLITIGLNTSGSYQSIEEPMGGVWDIFNAAANKTRPTIPAYYSNGEFGAYDGNENFPFTSTPLYSASRVQNTDSYKFDGKVYATVEPVSGLQFTSSFAYQLYNDKYKADIQKNRYYTAEGTFLENGIPTLDVSDIVRDQWIQENTLTWRASWNDAHFLTLLLGESTQHNGYRYSGANGMYFLSDRVHVMDAAQTTAAYGNERYANLFSLFARLNYNYRNRYLFEANIRRDETSRIPAKNRAGYFPSFSAGWNIAEEPFMQNQGLFDVLKLRVSWGKLGNQEIGYYPYAATYSIGDANYVWGDTKMMGAAATSAANSDIRWEVTRTFDVGLDASLFRDRLTASFDYYDKLSSDILLQLPISALLGVSEAPYVNAAQVHNRGWDANLGYRDHAGDFFYGINLNVSHVNNVIDDVNGRENWIDGWTINRAGSPIGAYYGYVAEGLYSSQEEIDAKPVKIGAPHVGDLKYADLDNDGEITDKDRQVIGNPFPEFTYGLNLTAAWRNLDVAVFFQGVAGIERIFLDFPTVEGGVTLDKMDRYHATANPNGKFPAMGNQAYNQVPSSFWIKDASYLRLKNLEIGYTFPHALKGIRVFFSGQNLFTLTKVTNFDPEKVAGDSNNATYPNARMYSLGLNIKL